MYTVGTSDFHARLTDLEGNDICLLFRGSAAGRFFEPDRDIDADEWQMICDLVNQAPVMAQTLKRIKGDIIAHNAECSSFHIEASVLKLIDQALGDLK